VNSYAKRIEWVRGYLELIGLEKDLTAFYRNRSILVTGGAGAIGSNLIIALSHLVGPDGRIVVLGNL